MDNLLPLILDASTRPGKPVGKPRTLGGQPVQRFEKEIIRCGTFVKEADNIRFTITPLTLSHWVKTFKKFTAAGNKVYAPAGHTNDPEKNKGWVVDLIQRGDSLFGVFDLVGEDAIALAGRTDVSIYSPASYIDAHGNEYERPITHVALCSEPVIPGLSGWMPLAASKGSQVKAVRLTIVQRHEKWLHPKPLALEASKMPDVMDPNNPQALLNPDEAGGGEGENKDLKLADTIDAAVEEQILGIFRGEGDVKAKLSQLGDLIKRHGKIKELLNLDGGGETPPAEGGEGGEEPPVVMSEDEDKDDEEKKAAIEASRTKVGSVVLRLAAENYTLRINDLVRQRKISPAVATELKNRFFGKNNGSLSLSLSRAPKSGRIELDGIIAALEKNSPLPAMGEKSQAQVKSLVLSNPIGSTGGTDADTEEAVEAMWKAAGVEPPKRK